MHTITAIETQAKNPQRVNIYLDGAFGFGLAKLVAAWLKVNQEISDEKISDLVNEDEREIAFQKTLHFIDYRPRSSDEVRRHMHKQAFSVEVIENTIERLKNSGLINDEAFARSWVENRNAFRPRGQALLRMELRRKGLAEEVIQSVLDEQTDEESLCLAAARKQARRLSGLEYMDFRSKLAGHLGRRGFSYEVIAPVVSQIWQEERMAETGEKTENEVEK
jgi:regulatory protein